MAFILKRYNVSVVGFSDVVFCASTPGRARSRAWDAYNSAYPCSFKRFLQISRVTRNHQPLAHFGDPITVGGEPAFFVGYAGGNSIHFVRDDSDDVRLTHELDATLPWQATEQQNAGIPERGTCPA